MESEVVEIDDELAMYLDLARAAHRQLRDAVARAQAELGDTGRILLRPSGTEQIVRVMVEASDEDTARHLASRVAESVSDEG